MAERRYVTGKYEEYYNSLRGEAAASSKASSFVSEVSNLVTEFNNVKEIMVYWSGEAKDSMSTEAISAIMDKFSTTEANIQDALVPCCEAIDTLSQNLDTMKTKEDELLEKEDELEKLKSNEPDKTKKNSEGKEEKNPEYDKWKEKVETLEQEIKALETELDELKTTVDTAVSQIEALEGSLQEFSNYMSMTSSILGIDASSSFSNYSLDERIQYLQDLVDNYQQIYDSLDSLYQEKYGKGFQFTAEDFKQLDFMFDAFDIYWMSKVDRDKLVKSENGDTVLFDIDKLTQVISYCNSNDVFTKIDNYMNGASWKDSGLESLYQDGSFLDTSSANFLNFNAYDENKFKQRLKDKYGVTGDVREYLKENMGSVVESYKNLMNSYGDYQKLTSNMAVVKSKIDNLEQAKKLMPYEIQMENSDFKSYLEKDYSGYGLLSQEQLSVMSQQEVALYDYLYHTKSKEEANAYLNAMENTMNQRIGAYRAAEYIEYIKQGGYGVDDLLASGFEGTKDGVRNFFDGIADVFRVANTEAGTKSALDYEMMYKAQYMQELMNDSSYVDQTLDKKTLGFGNITNWYNTGTSVGNMAVPSIVSFIPVVGKPLSTALMTASIAGNSAVEAKQEGYSTAQAYVYGAITGASETFTEVMMGGIPGISNLEGKGLLSGMLSEGLEEFTQEYLDVGVRWAVLGEKPETGLAAAKERFNNAMQAGVQGALTSGIMQGGNAVAAVGANTVVQSVSPTVTQIDGTVTKKYNSFAEFKNGVESDFYTPRAQSAIDNAVSKTTNGETLSLTDKIKLNRSISNVSAQELSSITSNMTQEQTDALRKASSGIPKMSSKTNTKINESRVFNEVEKAKSLSTVSGLTEETLNEEVTRDGRTLAEYIADNKSGALDTTSMQKIESIDSKTAKEINNRVQENQKRAEKQISKALKNGTIDENTLRQKLNNGTQTQRANTQKKATETQVQKASTQQTARQQQTQKASTQQTTRQQQTQRASTQQTTTQQQTQRAGTQQTTTQQQTQRASTQQTTRQQQTQRASTQQTTTQQQTQKASTQQTTTQQQTQKASTQQTTTQQQTQRAGTQQTTTQQQTQRANTQTQQDIQQQAIQQAQIASAQEQAIQNQNQQTSTTQEQSSQQENTSTKKSTSVSESAVPAMMATSSIGLATALSTTEKSSTQNSSRVYDTIQESKPSEKVESHDSDEVSVATKNAFESNNSSSNEESNIWQYTIQHTSNAGKKGTVIDVDMSLVNKSLTPEGNLKVAKAAWEKAGRPKSGDVYRTFQTAYAYSKMAGGTNTDSVSQLHQQDGNINYKTSMFRSDATTSQGMSQAEFQNLLQKTSTNTTTETDIEENVDTKTELVVETDTKTKQVEETESKEKTDAKKGVTPVETEQSVDSKTTESSEIDDAVAKILGVIDSATAKTNAETKVAEDTTTKEAATPIETTQTTETKTTESSEIDDAVAKILGVIDSATTKTNAETKVAEDTTTKEAATPIETTQTTETKTTETSEIDDAVAKILGVIDSATDTKQDTSVDYDSDEVIQTVEEVAQFMEISELNEEFKYQLEEKISSIEEIKKITTDIVEKDSAVKLKMVEAVTPILLEAGETQFLTELKAKLSVEEQAQIAQEIEKISPEAGKMFSELTQPGEAQNSVVEQNSIIDNHSDTTTEIDYDEVVKTADKTLASLTTEEVYEMLSSELEKGETTLYDIQRLATEMAEHDSAEKVKMIASSVPIMLNAEQGFSLGEIKTKLSVEEQTQVAEEVAKISPEASQSFMDAKSPEEMLTLTSDSIIEDTTQTETSDTGVKAQEVYVIDESDVTPSTQNIITPVETVEEPVQKEVVKTKSKTKTVDISKIREFTPTKVAQVFSEMIDTPIKNSILEYVTESNTTLTKEQFQEVQKILDYNAQLENLILDKKGMTLHEFVEECGKTIPISFDTYSKYEAAAYELLQKVKQVEPSVSELLKSMITDGEELVGFEHRFKSIDSIIRKMDKIGSYNAADYINDGLRYTMILNPDTYSSDVISKLQVMKAKGYTVDYVNNSWGNPLYQGLNVGLITPEGIKMELQFHTKESYAVKEKMNHSYYEIARSKLSTPSIIKLSNTIMGLTQSTFNGNIPTNAQILSDSYIQYAITPTFREYKNYQDFIDEYGDQSQAWFDSLDPELKKLFRNYTDEMDSQVGCYSTINAILRGIFLSPDGKTVTIRSSFGNETISIAEFEQKVKMSVHDFIEKSIEAAERMTEAMKDNILKENTRIYRGMNLDALKSYGITGTESEAEIFQKLTANGEYYFDQAFMSSSPTPKSITSEKEVILVIDCYKGTPVLDLSCINDYERETLFPPGSKFHIDKVVKNNGKIEIHVSSLVNPVSVISPNTSTTGVDTTASTTTYENLPTTGEINEAIHDLTIEELNNAIKESISYGDITIGYIKDSIIEMVDQNASEKVKMLAASTPILLANGDVKFLMDVKAKLSIPEQAQVSLEIEKISPLASQEFIDLTEQPGTSDSDFDWADYTFDDPTLVPDVDYDSVVHIFENLAEPKTTQELHQELNYELNSGLTTVDEMKKLTDALISKNSSEKVKMIASSAPIMIDSGHILDLAAIKTKLSVEEQAQVAQEIEKISPLVSQKFMELKSPEEMLLFDGVDVTSESQTGNIEFNYDEIVEGVEQIAENKTVQELTHELRDEIENGISSIEEVKKLTTEIVDKDSDIKLKMIEAVTPILLDAGETQFLNELKTKLSVEGQIQVEEELEKISPEISQTFSELGFIEPPLFDFEDDWEIFPESDYETEIAPSTEISKDELLELNKNLQENLVSGIMSNGDIKDALNSVVDEDNPEKIKVVASATPILLEAGDVKFLTDLKAKLSVEEQTQIAQEIEKISPEASKMFSELTQPGTNTEIDWSTFGQVEPTSSNTTTTAQSPVLEINYDEIVQDFEQIAKSKTIVELYEEFKSEIDEGISSIKEIERITSEIVDKDSDAKLQIIASAAPILLDAGETDFLTDIKSQLTSEEAVEVSKYLDLISEDYSDTFFDINVTPLTEEMKMQKAMNKMISSNTVEQIIDEIRDDVAKRASNINKYKNCLDTIMKQNSSNKMKLITSITPSLIELRDSKYIQLIKSYLTIDEQTVISENLNNINPYFSQVFSDIKVLDQDVADFEAKLAKTNSIMGTFTREKLNNPNFDNMIHRYFEQSLDFKNKQMIATELIRMGVDYGIDYVNYLGPSECVNILETIYAYSINNSTINELDKFMDSIGNNETLLRDILNRELTTDLLRDFIDHLDIYSVEEVSYPDGEEIAIYTFDIDGLSLKAMQRIGEIISYSEPDDIYQFKTSNGMITKQQIIDSIGEYKIYKQFTSYKDYTRIYESIAKDWGSNLNPEVRQFFENYASQNEHKVGCYKTLNGILRGTAISPDGKSITVTDTNYAPKTYTDTEWKAITGMTIEEFKIKSIEAAQQMSEAIEQLKLIQPTEIIRGINFGSLSQYGILETDTAEEIFKKLTAKGDFYEDNGFMSSSPTPGDLTINKKIKLIMHCDAGTPVADLTLSGINNIPGENEVLFPPKTLFHIDSVVQIDGETIIHLSTINESTVTDISSTSDLSTSGLVEDDVITVNSDASPSKAPIVVDSSLPELVLDTTGNVKNTDVYINAPLHTDVDALFDYANSVLGQPDAHAKIAASFMKYLEYESKKMDFSEAKYYNFLNLNNGVLPSDDFTKIITQLINADKSLRESISSGAMSELSSVLAPRYGITDPNVIKEIHDCLLGANFIEEGLGQGSNWSRFIEIIENPVQQTAQQLVDSGKEPVIWSGFDDEYHDVMDEKFTTISNTSIGGLTFIESVFVDWYGTSSPFSASDLWAKLSVNYANSCCKLTNPATGEPYTAIKFLYPTGKEKGNIFGELFKSSELPRIVANGTIKTITLTETNPSTMEILNTVNVDISELIDYYKSVSLSDTLASKGIVFDDVGLSDTLFEMFKKKVEEVM